MVTSARKARCRPRTVATTVVAAVLTSTLVSQTTLAETQQEEFAAILASADATYGEYLAGQCVTCHRAGGGGNGIPPIAGLPDTYIVQVMLDYKNAREERTNPAMVNVAKNLSDEELGSLALHFSNLKAE